MKFNVYYTTRGPEALVEFSNPRGNPLEYPNMKDCLYDLAFYMNTAHQPIGVRVEVVDDPIGNPHSP